jgi:hypothetical protein
VSYKDSFNAAPVPHVAAWLLAGLLVCAMWGHHQTYTELKRVCLLIDVFSATKVMPAGPALKVDSLCSDESWEPWDRD